MPFHSIGLWLAVTLIPPSHSSSRIITPTVGVVLTPRRVTSQPTPARPAAAAEARRWGALSGAAGGWPWCPSQVQGGELAVAALVVAITTPT